MNDSIKVVENYMKKATRTTEPVIKRILFSINTPQFCGKTNDNPMNVKSIPILHLMKYVLLLASKRYFALILYLKYVEDIMNNIHLIQIFPLYSSI